jgi:hypothetical protein
VAKVLIRRPVLKVTLVDDKIKDDIRMWYHLKVKNEELKGFNRYFNRDSASQCIARIEFLNKITLKRLIEIEAHWKNLPEPRSGTKVDYTLVPMSKRMDIGFRAEEFDVLVKNKGEKHFYAADPLIIYSYVFEKTQCPKNNDKLQNMKINEEECIIRVELEAINLGKRDYCYFKLKNSCSTKMDSIKISQINRRDYNSLEKEYNRNSV